MKKKEKLVSVEKLVSLNIAGRPHRYIYNQEKDEVYTEEFPGIPVESVNVCFGKLKHDTLRDIIRVKLGLPPRGDYNIEYDKE